MVSKLSKRIEDFELRLKQLESSHQDITFKAVLELTKLVHELSQKIDQQQQATTLHG
jgi:chaperonin cofactor prefoldin